MNERQVLDCVTIRDGESKVNLRQWGDTCDKDIEIVHRQDNWGHSVRVSMVYLRYT